MFFASESDKTPVRQWPIATITKSEPEKAKHVAFDASGTALHFNPGSQSTAEAIYQKFQSSKTLASGSSSVPAARSLPPPLKEENSPVVKAKKSVNFATAPAEVIDNSDSEESEPEESRTESSTDIASATILYSFTAEGDDELSVSEGDRVFVVDREGSQDWWKVRDASGAEGVVPALYVKVCTNCRPASKQHLTHYDPSGDRRV